MGKLKNHKINNNKGSTIIVVLIMSSFIMILATAISTTVMLNVRMKIAKGTYKTTFYTAEEAIDEVYVSLGKVAIDSFTAAYTDELTHLNETRDLDLDEIITNVEANERFRKNFMARVIGNLNLLDNDKTLTLVSDIYGADTMFANYDRSLTVEEKEIILESLQSYLENDNSGELMVKDLLGAKIVFFNEAIKDTNGTDVSIENYKLVLESVVVSYKTSQGYYANISVDIDLGFPARMIALVDNELEGRTDFTDYVLVGNTGIVVAGVDDTVINSSESIETGANLNVYGNIYGGGKTGITLNKNANLNFNGSSLNNAVSASDITVNGGNLNINGGRVWTQNIFTKLYPSNISIGAAGSVYAKDDLQLEADNSMVTINGNFYGYGYVPSDISTHAFSSSLIIDANKSTININSGANVLLSGNAYITYDDKANPYATGFSYASYGDQESYLVPSKYLSSEINPAPLLTEALLNTAGNTGQVIYKGMEVRVNIDNSFFAYNLLNETQPYTIKVIPSGDGTGGAYYYLNFKNQALKAVYAKLIEDNTAYESYRAYSYYYANATEKEKEEYDTVRNSLNQLITVNSNATASDIYVSNNANMIAISDRVYDGFSANLGANPESLNYDFSDFYAKYTNYSIRYNILHKILYAVENTDTNLLTAQSVGTESVPNVSPFSNNVFNNFINPSGFKSYITNRGVSAHNYGVATYNDYMLVAIDNENTTGSALVIDYNLPRSDFRAGQLRMKKGVVVASGDVVVRSDFTGVIMAKGTITVEDNVTVYSLNQSEVEKMIDKDKGIATELGTGQYPFKSIFNYGYEKPELDESETNLSYNEMVKVYNWSNK